MKIKLVKLKGKNPHPTKIHSLKKQFTQGFFLTLIRNNLTYRNFNYFITATVQAEEVTANVFRNN